MLFFLAAAAFGQAPAEGAPASGEAGEAAAPAVPSAPAAPAEDPPPTSAGAAIGAALLGDSPASTSVWDTIDETEPAPRRVARRKTPAEKWIRSRVPDHLEDQGPLRIEWWQWLALPVALAFSAAFGRAARWCTARLVRRIVRATPGVWDDTLLSRNGRPLDLVWGLGALEVLVRLLYLREPTGPLVTGGLHVALFLALLWFAIRATDTAGEAATRSARHHGKVGAASVMPLVVRSAKIALGAVGLVTVLSSLGYPVTSLLAGLGLGGLALALAAQRTAENVFGSVSIGIDQPFLVGDLVKIEDVTGVVERIGLRSTSVRTPDRTLVTWPNGKLAELRVENYASRDRIRFYTVLALAPNTQPGLISPTVTHIEARLRTERSVWASDCTARVIRVGSTAIDVEISAMFTTTPDEFGVIRQALILDILEILAAGGIALAAPADPVKRPLAP